MRPGDILFVLFCAVVIAIINAIVLWYSTKIVGTEDSSVHTALVYAGFMSIGIFLLFYLSMATSWLIGNLTVSKTTPFSTLLSCTLVYFSINFILLRRLYKTSFLKTVCLATVMFLFLFLGTVLLILVFGRREMDDDPFVNQRAIMTPM